ncbi:MAG: pseudouridine synthase [Opitutaceae bacterium]
MSLPPILFEDDSLIAFDKPSGLLVVPDAKDRRRESLMPLIHARFGDSVVNVHRIDSEASGVFLCAKTKLAQDFVSGQFQSKTALKKFLALVVALPAQEPTNKLLTQTRSSLGALLDEFSIDAAIGEDEVQKGRMRVIKKHGGQDSITEFSVLERFGRFNWIEVRPITGRRHQLRAHLAAARAFVLNDRVYGDGTKLMLSDLKRGYKGRDAEKPLIARLALHASEITIRHPLTRESLNIAAPLPDDLAIALKNLRKFQPSAARQSSKGRAEPEKFRSTTDGHG